jgi:hypothetical protein
MAAAVKILYEKVGKNFKTTVFGITLTGNYPGNPGEVVTLTSGASNPQATTVTGPSGAPPLPPTVTASTISGYVPTLTATATPGQFDLSFAYGATAFAGAYAANSSVTVEVDHDLQGL